ncbi:hypothetical protein [Cupriavidus necator]
MNFIKGHFSRKAIATGVAFGALAASASAHAGLAEIFAAVDLSTVVTFVGATGLVIVAIALAMKGIGLAKRAISKA